MGNMATARATGMEIEDLPLAYEFDVSLVVVATNVEVDLESFGEMIDSFRRVFHENNLKAEFIVVDDGVGGPFFEALQALNREVPNFRVIRFRRTFGESVALRIATERARGEFILTNTWYVQVKPEAALDVIRRLRDGADFVAASRTPRIDSILARLQSWFFNVLTRWLTKVSFHDLNCSFRGFKKHVIDAIHFHGDLFRFVPVLAVGQGFRVEEIPVLHVAEKGPSTFLNVSLYIRRVLDVFSLFFLMKFIRKPLRFFGLTGLALFFVGSLLSGWVAYQKFFMNIGAVDRPALVLGVLFMVLGPILLSIGLIGEIIIFTQGKTLSDYHIGTILSGREIAEGDREDEA
ncbi:MAG: glycosyltransferase [Planctomycetes bacterium]|nr:glycosyltransferase [Planctomycetota bacterium]